MRRVFQLGLVAGGLLYIIGCNRASKSDTSPAAAVSAGQAKIRGINLTSDLPSLGISVNGVPVIKNIAADNESIFTPAAVGKLQMYALAADGKVVSKSMLFALENGEQMSAVAIGSKAAVELIPFKHKNKNTDAHAARLTVLNVCKDTTGLVILLDGKKIAAALPFRGDSPYGTVQPGKHLLQVDYQHAVSNPTTKLTSVQTLRASQRAEFEAGGAYTALLYADAWHRPQVIVLEDRDTEPQPAKEKPIAK